MVFGEIVEPSTRALILDDEELEELPEYKSPVYKWNGNFGPPETIESIFVAESQKVLQICSHLTTGSQPILTLVNEGLSVYGIGPNYIITFNSKCNELTIGEIVELIAPWIKKAKHVHCITSSPTSAFQSLESSRPDTPITFCRCITTLPKVPYNFCKRLEPPNLVQGLCASVLSYCICSQITASLWVVYTENMPIDSANAAEILRLFEVLGLKVAVNFKRDVLSSNLYM